MDLFDQPASRSRAARSRLPSTGSASGAASDSIAAKGSVAAGSSDGACGVLSGAAVERVRTTVRCVLASSTSGGTAATVAANEADPKLNPAGLVIQAIRQEIRLTKMFSFLGMNTATFVGIVERNGIAIKPEIKGNIASNRWVDDKVQTFTVKATGQAGKVQRTVTAVIRSDDVLGKFLYYRQE